MRKIIREDDDGYIMQDFYSNGAKKYLPIESLIKKVNRDGVLSIYGEYRQWHLNGNKKYFYSYLEGGNINGKYTQWYKYENKKVETLVGLFVLLQTSPDEVIKAFYQSNLLLKTS